ncbi:MAG: hypothetical protein JNN15_14840 [Blastocatellia bacterium]|nr:hypothetical protein [Blastocatellia bacterium]
MKSRVQKFFVILVIFTFTGFLPFSAEAQLGRTKKTPENKEKPTSGSEKKPTPPSEPTTTSTPKGGGNKRKPTKPVVSKSAVPKGQPLEFYVTQGSKFLDNGDYKLASLYLEEGKKRNDKKATPELLDVLEKQLQVSKLHLQIEELADRDDEKVIDLYREILKLKPSDQKSSDELTAIYKRAGEKAFESKNYAKALDLFKELLKAAPDKEVEKKIVVSLLAVGEQQLKAGNEEAAYKTFKEVTSFEPKNSRAIEVIKDVELKADLKFAENKLSSGAYEDALKKFQEVLSISPNNEQAKKGLQLAQGNYQKQKADQFYVNRKYIDAEREYKEALEILKEDEHIRGRLQELDLRLGSPLPLKGKIAWKGKVSKPVKITIKGRNLDYDVEGVEGKLTDKLPDVSYTIKRIKKLSGESMPRILENPTSANGYATVVAIDSKKEEDAAFEIEWELKRQGKLAWSGKVSGRTLLRVQGPFVDLEQISGTAAEDVKFQIDGLPHQDSSVKVRKLSGKPEVRVVEAPSQANLYIATLAIESSSEELETIAFEMEWLIK